MSELVERSATELAGLIRAGQVSSEEVVEAHLDRIARLNPSWNAFVTLCADDARAQARAADARRARGDALGPLHGVPFSVNDALDTAGVRTTSGTGLAGDRVPERDAVAVARLKAAGGILLGKTNLPELGANFDCQNPLFGATVNPHDPRRTAGGTCGGEAAALAGRLTPLGLGKDAAGSIRVPASFCGVFGYVPSPGRIPVTGVFPDALRLYCVNGPLARTVEDLELALGVMAGPDPSDPASLPLGGEPSREVRPETLRVALCNPGGTPLSKVVQDALERAASALEQAGLEVAREEPPLLQESLGTFWSLLSQEGAFYVDEIVQGRWDRLGPDWAGRGDAPLPQVSASQLIRWRHARTHLVAEVLAWLERHPVVLAPVYATTAFPSGARSVDVNGTELPIQQAGAACGWANFVGAPAVAVPAGVDPAGLPTGVQVIARPWRDAEVLAVARVLEERLGGCSPLPEGASA